MYACGAYNKGMQYTVRNVPDALDAALRERARKEGRSLNEVTLQAIARGMGFSATRPRQRDLSDLRGTWCEDPEFDQAIADQDRIDPELWK